MSALAERALRGFGVAGADIHVVAVGENAIFKVVSDRSRPLVLRLHRSQGRDRTSLESELQWLCALRHAAACVVPEPVTASNGRRCLEVEDDTWRYATLLTWVAGDPWVSTCSKEQVFRLGRAVASLHAHAVAWQPGPAFRRPRFTARHVLGQSTPLPLQRIASHVDPVGAAELERAVECSVQMLDHAAETRTQYGLQHSDLRPENLLQTPDGIGIIDFDDTLVGPFAYDIVVCLEPYLDRDPEQIHHSPLIRAFTAGYATFRKPPTLTDALVRACYFVRKLGVLSWSLLRFGRVGDRDVCYLERARSLLLRSEISG